MYAPWRVVSSTYVFPLAFALVLARALASPPPPPPATEPALDPSPAPSPDPPPDPAPAPEPATAAHTKTLHPTSALRPTTHASTVVSTYSTPEKWRRRAVRQRPGFGAAARIRGRAGVVGVGVVLWEEEEEEEEEEEGVCTARRAASARMNRIVNTVLLWDGF
ncbi:hypothetical protein JR316_0008338 [Psilocybe cubensis]|uniref:Uncharacterized protein n=1 Tax=Psilocybe cubensis TaxID=181762 RepID=A0ACB8GW48_PSICU|nr:hypothetical protein JR316_0008338 [Psilocybe cubensis]KAH9479743.1 hypothetical protein JR316_0008338 [Psilocybe cubensis]